jgi:3-dehydroquinate synthase
MADGAHRNLSEITIESTTGDYAIKFQALETLEINNAYVLMDEKLQGSINVSRNRTVLITAKEDRKTLSAAEDAIVQLSEKGMTKNNELVVVGGGNLQDIGTLVASLYMRGVKWVYVPTTLAAMGDSCVGGKSSINAGYVKNLVGNFYPPRLIIVDPAFVSTLPNLEIVAGLSEIVKICFARSSENFYECIKLISDWNENSNESTLTDVIQLSLRSKKYFVEIDEFDTGARKILNFGHSFGHALESASDYRIPHGVAVLIGMIAACQHPLSEVSQQTKKLIDFSLTLSKKVSKEIATAVSSVDFEKFSQALEKDKKNSELDLVLVLPQATGLEIVKIPFDQDALSTATRAIKLGIGLVLNEIR